jgi:hypothetical protein
MKKSLRTSAVVPRSLLKSTRFLGIGVVPLSIFAYGCGNGSPSIGIDVSMTDGGTSPEGSIGIRPAMDFDARTPESSIGIRPAMDFDAGTPDTSIGIRPAMDFDAASDAPQVDDGGDGDTDASTTDAGGV